MSKRILIHTITILIGSFICGCSTLQDILKIQRPTASLQGIRFGAVSLESASLLFDIEIENPYPVDLPLLNMTYNLNTSGNKLFDGKADIHGIIPPKNKKTLSLPVRIAYLDVLKAVGSFKPGAAIPYQANVGLSIDAPSLGVIQLPISHSGQLAIPEIPRAGDINWQKLLK